jgi:hypothetical protein
VCCDNTPQEPRAIKSKAKTADSITYKCEMELADLGSVTFLLKHYLNINVMIYDLD